MEDILLDPTCEGIALTQLTLVAAMMAGAVSGALAGWLAKRNVGLALCTFMIGIMGGLLIGTGMGRWLYVGADGMEVQVTAAACSLCSGTLAGLAGAIPTALVVPNLVIAIVLRHVRNRPPRVKTGLQAGAAGIVTGLATALVRLLV